MTRQRHDLPTRGTDAADRAGCDSSHSPGRALSAAGTYAIRLAADNMNSISHRQTTNKRSGLAGGSLQLRESLLAIENASVIFFSNCFNVAGCRTQPAFTGLSFAERCNSVLLSLSSNSIKTGFIRVAAARYWSAFRSVLIQTSFLVVVLPGPPSPGYFSRITERPLFSSSRSFIPGSFPLMGRGFLRHINQNLLGCRRCLISGQRQRQNVLKK